ncbi:hypothetical protein [Microbulbifer sp. 2201CG32-9]|uniref:hypothetical protein n=1 Tax=unclassified Microbulbifer TaxID=2619833 RepID=UPI00345BE9F1
MTVAIVRFYCMLFLGAFLPVAGEIRLPSPHDAQARRYTRAYRARQKRVKKLWLGSCLLMLCFPLVPFVLALSLFTSLLSFAILDETV